LKEFDDRAVDAIFSEALERPRHKRDRFVRDRCGDNRELQRRVLELLAAADTPDEALSGPFDTAREALWLDSLEESDIAGEDLSGQQIDGWTVFKRVARGGLATVYLARRSDGSFDQKAALKVLRRGLDTDDVIARFRAERQILSSLDHPSIARIIDGGALADGRPYLVLDFIDGIPISQYCDRNGLDIRARVRLLIDVLDALDHAHRHLIIHRDIKPSNILVTDDGHVSLLDFGISKLLDPSALPGAATWTRTGVALLTPGYGSPEQYAGQPVTTASDIYQVGLVAYELISGKRPFNEPRLPGELDVVAPSRVLESTRQRREVAGDLDAIVCKALNEEPARRYGSAQDMRADLQRYLDHRPIIARPDTLGYRFTKLARRRPWLVPILLVSVLAIAGYLATLTSYNRQLRFEQQRAQAAESFMVDLLGSSDPFSPADPELGSAITVVQALDIGVERLKAGAKNDAGLKASLLHSIASVYAALDQPAEAIELAEQALALKRRLHGDPSSEMLASFALLAEQHQVRGENESALRYREAELETARQLYPPAHPGIGVAQAGAAGLQWTLGNIDEAERLYSLAIDTMRQAPEACSRPLINALVALSGLLSQRDLGKSTVLLEEARLLAIRVYGEDSLAMAQIHARAATTASNHQRYADSEAAFKASLNIYRARLGEQHAATLSALNNLGVLHLRAGDLGQAEQVFSKLLALSQVRYGDDHQSTAGQLQNLGAVMGRQGRWAEALALHRQAFEVYRDLMPEHYLAAYPLISMAYAQLQQREPAAAEYSARQALERLEDIVANAYAIGVAQCLAGLAMEDQGRVSEGAVLLQEAQTRLDGLMVDSVYASACRLAE